MKLRKLSTRNLKVRYNPTMLVFVVLLIGSAAVVQGQRPIPCCAPKQFTVRYDEVASLQKGFDPMEIADQSMEAAYDFISGMVGMEISDRIINRTEIKMRLVQNFTSGYQWVIEGTQCFKQRLGSESYPNRCIPEGALYEGSFTVGLEHLRVSAWLIDAGQSGSLRGHQHYTVTDYMCTPYSSIFIGSMTTTTPPTNFVSSGNYLNFVDRIEDPDRWFHLPPSCLNATAVPASEELFKIPRSHLVRNF